MELFKKEKYLILLGQYLDGGEGGSLTFFLNV